MRLDLFESISLAEKNGIPFAKHSLAKNERELGEKLSLVGPPIALKLVSSVSHKTEFGGVKLGVDRVEEAKAFFKKMKRKCAERKAEFKGVLVQKEVPGLELIIGAKTDQQFGPVILFGLGGTLVEVMKDFSLRLVPITRKDAGQMIREIKGFPLLKGYRGQPGVALKELENVLLKVSSMIEKENIRELDLNPLIGSGKKILAVDARVVL